MNTADVIDGAIEHIQTVGWCQNILATPDGAACLIGALMVGAGARMFLDDEGDVHWNSDNEDSDAYYNAEDTVAGVLQAEMGEGNIPTFNDECATSKEDILLILKKAREACDE